MKRDDKVRCISSNTLFEWMAAASVIVVMVGLAELLKESEIIFPEIAAISIGYIMSPKKFWMVNSIRMIVAIGICSGMGVMLIRWGPSNIWLQVMIAFSLGQFILILSGTSFSPMISAIILPVILKTDTWIYPISAIVLTTMIALFREILVSIKVKDREEFIAKNNMRIENLAKDFVRIVSVAIFSFITIRFGFTFTIAPPLLVYFVEITNKAYINKNMIELINSYISKIIFIVACASIGAFSRILLFGMMGFSIIGIALIQTIILIAIVHFTEVYLPPAGALMILSLLIPYDKLIYYPLQITLGAVSLTIIGTAITRIKSNKIA